MENLKEELIDLLETIKKDAEMALSGEWGVAEYATDEQKEGFEAQIELIDSMLIKLEEL